MKYPLVSVITPCYNGEKYLDRYFKSILNQTYPNFELIFVNDGSNDRTEEIALSYKNKLEEKNIRYIYIYQENSGQAEALNRGLKIFNGDYLTWIDSDDVMVPNCIEKKVIFLEKNKKYEMVRSNGIYFNEAKNERKRIDNSINIKNEDIFDDLLVLKTYGCCGCYMITRKIFLKIFPDRIIYNSRCGQNWQLLVPIASNTLCGYIDEDLYIVYLTEDSHSRKEKDYNKLIKRYDAFLDVLVHAIEISNCNKEKKKKMVCEFCYRNQFYYAIALKEKDKIKKYFKRFCQFGNPTVKEFLLYIKYCYIKQL